MATHLHTILLMLGLILTVKLKVAQTKNSRDDEDKNKIEDILPHYAEDRHLDSFDQTLFLGGQTKAKSFRALPEAERKKVFAEVVKLVDTSGDGLIDKDELTTWMFDAMVTGNKEDAVKSMEPIDVIKDGLVSWCEYHIHIYRTFHDNKHKNQEEDLEEDQVEDQEEDQEEDLVEFHKDIKRSKRTYDLADRDGDGFLNANEYHMFRNPMGYREMENVVVMDTLEDEDTNGDGGIDITEFLGDFATMEDEDDIPDWVPQERRLFETELDQDGNGKLEGTEIFDTVAQVKPFREQAERAVDHLVEMADTDKDEHISFDEAMCIEALFVGKDQQMHFHINEYFVDEW